VAGLFQPSFAVEKLIRPCRLASQSNTFASKIEMKERGEYVVDIFACDPANSNMGVRRAKIHMHRLIP
jgi:hypothetical protein